MECKSGIYLGKATNTKYGDDLQNTFGFSDIGSYDGSRWKASENTVINISHFLMLHRLHELRVLPDSVERFADDKGFPHSWPDTDDDPDILHNRKYFLQKEITTPNPDEDINNLSDEAILKIKKF